MELHARMEARDPDEPHRASTPLELFFDLTFVVAIAQAGSSLHHELVDAHVENGLTGFGLAFFAIWWAWMNFTWFASAYDTDDATYRLTVFVQMAGVLILAAGVPRTFDGRGLGVITMGYVVMRLAMVAQWLRAARAHADCRRCALRYAVGIAALQLGWVARLAIPDDLTIESFLVLAAAELCVRLWAEAAGRTSWHPRHIAERYGLFTIIVLGESVLAATVGVQAALDADSSVGDLATLVVGGLLVMFAMWWIYFDLPTEELVDGVRRSFFGRLSGVFAWGYGHYFVFASAAAVGAGLAVGIDHATGHSELSDVEAGLTLTVPVAVFLVVVWLLHIRHLRAMPVRLYGTPATAALVAAASALPEPILVTGILLSALIAIDAIADRRRDPPVPP